MKESADVTCAVLTPFDVASEGGAREIISLFERHTTFRPTTIGSFEPITEIYSPDSIYPDCWEDPLFWRSKNSGAEGSLLFGRGNLHTSLSLTAAAQNVGEEVWCSFLKDAMQVMTADFGYVHLTSQQEKSDPEVPYKHYHPVELGMNTHDLRNGLPLPCWIMALGKAYQPHFDTFRQAPPPVKVWDIADSIITIRTLPHLGDVLDDYQALKRARMELMAAVGTPLFFGQDSVRIPAFQFSKDWPNKLSKD